MNSIQNSGKNIPADTDTRSPAAVIAESSSSTITNGTTTGSSASSSEGGSTSSGGVGLNTINPQINTVNSPCGGR